MGRIIYLLNYIVVLVLFVLLFPLQAMIAALIVLFSGSPVFFKQKRIGKDGSPFIFYKFRTMKSGADEWQRQYKHLNEAKGPVFKIHNDPRFTGIGSG